MTALRLLLPCLLLAAFAPLRAEPITELRIYHAHPGKLDALHARFRDHTCALFKKHGFEQLGYFVPVENTENILVYWVRFPSEEARTQAWTAFRNDPDWKTAYAASTTDGKLVAKIDSTLLLATDYSPESPVLAAKGDNRFFEWRTYTTRPARLPNLHARFRDHTCGLFAKHGITNIAYWVYRDGEEKADVTLTYLVAHEDQDAKKKGWSGFSKDPDWQSARKASEADGPILAEKGIKVRLLKATDYSPAR